MNLWENVFDLVERRLDDQGENAEEDRLGRIEAQLSRIERILDHLARFPAQSTNVRASRLPLTLQVCSRNPYGLHYVDKFLSVPGQGLSPYCVWNAPNELHTDSRIYSRMMEFNFEALDKHGEGLMP